MKVKTNNPLANLFRAVGDVINSLVHDNVEQQNRAVTIGNIWTTVQKHLDESGGNSDQFGDTFSGGYVLDVYLEGAGAFAIVTHSDGKLYKIPVTLDADSQITLGEEQVVVIDFKPVTARGITVKRQADGRMRWFAMPACTAVLNRSGEIDSRALFDSFVEHVERGGAYPELDFFHLGERLILGSADWIARDGFAFCASGLFDETAIGRAAAAALEADPNYWGLSIAYLPTQEPEKLRSADGIEIPVYNAGINRYISLLPENTAASILTSISTGEEVNRMEKKVKDALKKLVGDDTELFDNIVATVDDVNRSAAGMINRSQEPATQSAPAKAKAKAESVKPVARELSAEEIEAVLASDKFTEIFDAKLSAALEARSNQADEEADNKKEETSEESDQAPAEETADTNRAILAALTDLKARVDDLSKSREAEVQEVLNDLPARIAKTPIVRPRATRMPADLNSRARLNMADIASQTLAAMGESA